MTLDYYISLVTKERHPEIKSQFGLSSGAVDEYLTYAYHHGEKEKARLYYISQVSKVEFAFPQDLQLEPNIASLPHSACFGFDISFTLKSPWYSKDDRPFHVLENPVRKDRLFGVPFMSAATWKGLLRWACRMNAGLFNHLETHNMNMDGWKDPPWIIHLFGNEKKGQEYFHSGALVFYPTWFDKISIEVINPHNRKRRAGTHPVYYEVVPAGTKGTLHLLYAPLPGEAAPDEVSSDGFITKLIKSIQELLETYGISAKRTAGWGAAEIDYEKSQLSYMEGGILKDLIRVEDTIRQYTAPQEVFKALMDEEGKPISILLDSSGDFLSKTQFKKISEEKPCTNNQFEEFKEWYEVHGNQHKSLLKGNDNVTPSIQTKTLSLDKFPLAMETRENVREGGDQ